MTRSVALSAAVALAVAVLAQDVAPAWAGFHTWQYAGALAILMIPIASYAGAAARGKDGERGSRLLLAMGGALALGVAGLASGLLGADTLTISRAPGTVLPLPDLNAAAFFPNADAQSISQGDAEILLRHRDGSTLSVPAHGRRFTGSFALEVHPQTAAFIDARDEGGNHLTVTQPTGTAFLSPVLLFPASVQIEGQTLPADTFATPAVHRRIQAMYFSPTAARSTRVHQMVGDHPAILFAVDDDSGHLVRGGLGLAIDGGDAVVGGIRLRPAIGSYPALVLSAVPAPIAVIPACVAIVAGIVFAFVWPLRAGRAAGQPSQSLLDPAGTPLG